MNPPVTLTVQLRWLEFEMLLSAAAHDGREPEQWAAQTLIAAVSRHSVIVADASAQIAERSAELNRRLA